MSSRAPSASPDERYPSSSATSSADNDGLDKVELSDLDASPPRLPIEQDLMQLARLGELRSIQRLFDSGKYNAHSVDDEGITALHWAAINGHHALCHFLIQSGANVDARGGNAQATPVLWASKRCHLQVVSLLLASGADPLLKDDSGYNLLHSATLDGNVFQLVLLLHQSDLPVDVQDSHGHTSLMWAAYKGFSACVDILLRFGASVHATDETGLTALHWALVKGNYACVQKLVEYGSDLFARSKPTPESSEGDTPAMTASRMNVEHMWHKALVDSGYDESGTPMKFPIPLVKDRSWFYSRFFFFWPFALGGLQLYMLAHMVIWFAIPGVFLAGYGLQYSVQKLYRWAPSDKNTMHKTPVMAGIFAGSLFWVGFRWIADILPWTWYTNPFLNTSFAVCAALCTYFYVLTMACDPGYIPKGKTRGQTKKTIDELLEHNAFDELHFCTHCMIRKPLRSKHCRFCQRCIAREDHHCPWVDNCIGVNNHKHFMLYIMSLVAGIGFLIRLTIAYIEVLPPPVDYQCALLKDELCAMWSKDPLTLVTNSWGALQLTWTFMVLASHLTQIARNITTLETMRNMKHAGSFATAMLTGATTLDGAQVDATGAGPDPAVHTHSHKRVNFCSQWYRLLGIDTFLTVAFQGYNGSKNAKIKAKRPKAVNVFTRGTMRNCQDFWMDGPVFGRKQDSCKSLLGGQSVDYADMYDIPRGGMAYRRGGYEGVATTDVGEV